MLTTCIDFLVEAEIRKQKKSDFIHDFIQLLEEMFNMYFVKC